MNNYTVQEGDSLWGISEKLNINIVELACINNLNDENAHYLPIGLELKIPDASSQFDTELTLRIVDLAFVPLKNATLKLNYDGAEHDAVTNTEGLIEAIQIYDHAKGIKVQFKHLDGSFFLIADHKTLPLGKKLLTISSRKMVVKGNLDVKEGPQHQSTKQVTYDIKQKNQNAVIPADKKSTKPTTVKPAPAKKPAAPPVEPSWGEQIETSAEHASSAIKHKAGELYDSAKHGVQSVREWFSPTTLPQPVNKTVRTEGGAPTQVVSAIFAEENLRLSPANEKYRKLIIAAAKKYELTPHVLAALINVEARGGDKGWQEDSYNKKTKAAGLSQFLENTWLEMCTDARSPMNQRLKSENGYEQVNPKWDGDSYTIYGLKNKKKETIARGDVLPWRFNPAYSIDAAALYGRINLEQLAKKGINLTVLSPEDLAKLIYLAHHEGAGGAYSIIKGTLTEDTAAALLPKQVGEDKAEELIQQHGKSPKKAYTYWLYSYVDTVDVSHFMVNPKGLTMKTLAEITTALGAAPPPPPPSKNENKKPTPENKPADESYIDTFKKGLGGGIETIQNWFTPESGWHNPLGHCALRTAGLSSKKSSTFGMVRNGGKRAHQGIDLIAIPGTPIFAVADGKVINIQRSFSSTTGYGATLTLAVDINDLPEQKRNYYLEKHKNCKEIYFYYAHLSRIDVTQGKLCKAGTVLGATGDSGNAKGMNTEAKGAHLHFEAHFLKDGLGRGLNGRLDPLPFIENLL